MFHALMLIFNWDSVAENFIYPLLEAPLNSILKVKVKVTQLCPTLCDPVDYTVHGILQARILEWVAFPFSRGSSQPRIKPRSPTLQMDSLPAEPRGKAKNTGVAHPFSSGSSRPRNWVGVSCIASGFSTNWAIYQGSPNAILMNKLCHWHQDWLF